MGTEGQALACEGTQPLNSSQARRPEGPTQARADQAPLRRLFLFVGIGFLLFAPLLTTSVSHAEGETLEERVRSALLDTYIHGVTPKIAEEKVGRAGVPVLIALLRDPAFPRRDNVVAFLSYLADDSATPDILAYLRNPPAPLAIPEEDRALLLAPQALGHIAGRGHKKALAALMEATAHGADGGALTAGAERAVKPRVLRDDLLEMALLGLAYSRAPEARERLLDIESGRVKPSPQGRALGRAARSARDLLDSQQGGGKAGGPLSPEGNTDGGAATEASVSTAASSTGNTLIHDSGLDYVNHVDLSDPMSDARLDQLLAEGTSRARYTDFQGDVACCVTYSRRGTGRTFGTLGDGLDIVDSSDEMGSVLSDPSARFKVVRIINFCGAPGTNIIGCGYVSSYGAMVVRRSSLGSEAVLWVHEYGHNVGSGHNNDSRYIMYGTNYGTNDGVSQAECDLYYTPRLGALPDVVEAGACQASGCGDGICGPGEDCLSCASDCLLAAGATCGNGTCDTANGENCLSCPADCRGTQSGKPSKRFCCGDGGGENPVGCTDSRCTSGEYGCTDKPAGSACCGNMICEGGETSYSCGIDCGPPPACPDGVCNGGETVCSCPDDCGLPLATEYLCNDGVDNDCKDGADCLDPDCSLDIACMPNCGPVGIDCRSNAECCSGKCRGTPGARSCR